MAEPVRTALVTGASSGIGAATAVEFGRRGWRVALGARRRDRLQAVAKEVENAGGRAFAASLDVVDAASIEAFATAAEQTLGPIDLLVNNAGQNEPALIHEAEPDALRRDLEVNLLGAMWLTRRMLPGMLERRVGDVVFVGSDSAARPRPYQAAYAAAKAGLEAFARVLEMETEGTGVRSILMRVGPTGTEFGNRMPEARLPAMLASWKYWGVLRKLHWMPAKSVARAIARTVSIPVDEAYPTVVEVQPGGRNKENRS